MPSQGCYENLLVWQKAMDLLEEIYRLTRGFPKSEEFGLKSQMRRAALSIPSNIAEGQGRFHPKVFREFLFVALGSLYELRTQLLATVRLTILREADARKTLLSCDEIGRMLHGLIASIR